MEQVAEPVVEADWQSQFQKVSSNQFTLKNLKSKTCFGDIASDHYGATSSRNSRAKVKTTTLTPRPESIDTSGKARGAPPQSKRGTRDHKSVDTTTAQTGSKVDSTQTETPSSSSF